MLGHRLCNGLIALGYDVLAGFRATPDPNLSYLSMPVFRHTERMVTGLDAYDWNNLKTKIAGIRPDIVINCIGVIKQKREGQSSVPCIAINALLPHVLDDAVSGYGGLLFQISTDCVFKGDRGGYTEADAPDAEDWYGRTKAMGEVSSSNALTIRTSIIGPEISGRTSLVEWFLTNAGGRIKGFGRAIYSGLTTREMVRVVDCVLAGNPSLRGVYQVASNPISKYDLLVRLRNELGFTTEIELDTDFELDRSMSAARFAEATGYEVASWDEMISGLAADIREYWRMEWKQMPPQTAFAQTSQQLGKMK